MIRRTAAALAIATLFAPSAFAQSGCEDIKGLVESGAFVAEGSTIGFVVGARWGNGVLTLKDGTAHKFSFSGLKLLDTGVSGGDAVGTVYNLEKVEDFAGAYSGAGMGVAVVAGPGEVVMNNDKCVIVKARLTNEGVRLSPPGPNAVQVKLDPSS